MDKCFALFDMDRTLVDSMPFWDCLAIDFMEKRGEPRISPAVLEKIKPLTIVETAELLIQEYDLEETVETVSAELQKSMRQHYRQSIMPKEGINCYLQELTARGVKMGVVSATSEQLISVCLKRLDLLKYFDFILSCETVGIGKSSPAIYHIATEKLGAYPQNVAVYEDPLFAARTAKKAGYYVVGVYDKSSDDQWIDLRLLSDEYIECWKSGRATAPKARSLSCNKI